MNGPSRRTLALLALGLLLVGLLWRVVRYLLAFPVWGDEAMLAANFARLDFGQLCLRLENCQVAPLLFLWGQRAAFEWLGPGMLSMRLLPFTAGTLALFLYWRLTGLMLGPQARHFAVGFLAVAIWPVSMCTLIKPYSLDLLAALALILPAVQWMRDPERSRGLLWLALVAPVALLASYPAALVAGAVSVALLTKARLAPIRYAAFNAMCLVGFLLASRIGANQLATPVAGTSTAEGMATYWKAGFPPPSLLQFPPWLLLSLTGQIAAYPLGAANGGSALTAILAAIGAIHWARRGRWPWLCLALGPILLNLAASALHKYPFGVSCRLSQHLAPGICLLAGMGLAAALSRLRDSGRWAVAAAILFALAGVGGIVRDATHPYRQSCDLWAREVMAEMAREVPPDGPVIVCHPPDGMEAVFTWHWAARWRNVGWDYSMPEMDGEAWGFHHGPAADADAARARLLGALRARDSSWRLVRRVPFTHRELRCELFAFARR